ncbi:hypothetical protein LP414_20710 [Polaromonas sp. P1(28)-13]|nr:hypothetical protein LP414_20710 [Polaromonas sp. P1(28)-13]
MRTTHLLYLHGFRSSPNPPRRKKWLPSCKRSTPPCAGGARSCRPPRAAIELLMDGIASWPQEAGFESLAVVGSSLGGFYATWVAEQTGCKAALLNPAVNPARDLKRHIGEQTVWQNNQQRFFLNPALWMNCAPCTPGR